MLCYTIVHCSPIRHLNLDTTLQCIFFTAILDWLCILHCIIYNILYTVYSILYTLYSVLYTLYSILQTPCSNFFPSCSPCTPYLQHHTQHFIQLTRNCIIVTKRFLLILVSFRGPCLVLLGSWLGSFGGHFGIHVVSLGLGKPPSFPQRRGVNFGTPFLLNFGVTFGALLGPLGRPLGTPRGQEGRQGSPKRGLETECRQLDKQKDAQSQMVAQRELEDHCGVSLLSVRCHFEAPIVRNPWIL